MKNFWEMRLMSPAEDTTGGGGATTDDKGSAVVTEEPVVKPQPTVEELLAKLREKDDEIARVVKHKDDVLAEKKQLEKEKKENKSKSLEEQGDYQTLWKVEKERAIELEKAFENVKVQEQEANERLIRDARMEAAFSSLGGRDKLHNPDLISLGAIDRVVIDPTTKKFSEAGLKQFADEYRTKHFYNFKASEDATTAPPVTATPEFKAGGLKTKDELLKMTFEQRVIYARQLAKKS